MREEFIRDLINRWWLALETKAGAGSVPMLSGRTLNEALERWLAFWFYSYVRVHFGPDWQAESVLVQSWLPRASLVIAVGGSVHRDFTIGLVQQGDLRYTLAIADLQITFEGALYLGSVLRRQSRGRIVIDTPEAPQHLPAAHLQAILGGVVIQPAPAAR